MKILLTHPGTQHAGRLASALYKSGLLQCFATGIAFPDTPDAWWWKTARALGKEKLMLKRVVPGLPAGKLHLQPIKEANALFRQQVLRHSNDDVFYPRNKSFQEQLPQRLIDDADAVIGFDTSSWVLAKRCKEAGKPFILDASIAHPLAKEKVYERLRQQYPAWAGELAPKKSHLVEAELQEIEMASHIVVASAFTAKTYTDHGVPPEKISINPYGTDLKLLKPKILPVGRQVPGSKGEEDTGPGSGSSTTYPTFLFFGSLSARKGFPFLCGVWEDFQKRHPHSRLIAAGYTHLPGGFRIPDGIKVSGPVHPADRAALFASADVFVFPSFFEGFAQVILEAMICGLPVITTTATGGPDLMGAYSCGKVIEPGDEAALGEALEFFAGNPNQIAAMGGAAFAAASSFTWDAYGARWESLLRRIGGIG